MKRGVFITGTDTGIGKTQVCVALLSALNAMSARAVGMKPIASGCDETASGLRNDDALQLITASCGDPVYADVNPYAFADPIAPHLAAADAGIEIRLKPVIDAYAALSTNADFVVVEGVGGWNVPLSASLMLPDMVRALELPVILVVGLRLGCLNHALLSADAIMTDGCTLIGWIGNCIDPHMARIEDNIATLRERLTVPCLGILPHASTPVAGALAEPLFATARIMVSDAYPPVP